MANKTDAFKCAQQILAVPNTALLTSPSCKQCGGLKHAYWFGHSEMKNLAQAFIDLSTPAVGGK